MGNGWISRLCSFAARVLGLFASRKRDSDFDQEVQAHLQLLADRFVAQGMSQEDAAAAARRQFGNATQLQEERRGLRTLVSLEDLGRDLRYALRSLGRSRAFAAVAIVTLGLGIGASTAIFSVIDNVLLEPFLYKDAGRIVFPQIHGTAQAPGEGRQGYSSDELLEIARNNHVFESVIGTSDDPVVYKHGEGVEYLYGAGLTPGAFEFFGMPALYGRVLEPADYRPGAPPVFVMRYKTWKARFNGDPEVLNKTFVLNGKARTLVGIMPPRFGWYDADFYIPKVARPGVSAGSAAPPPEWFLLGRLKQGVSRAQAAADLTVIARHLAKIYPHDYPAHFRVLIKHIGDSVVGSFESPLYTVLAAVGLLLLIGCANVANLVLARATAREKEFALRAVFGAGRARLVRLLLVENLVLATGGAALGLLIAWGGLKLIVATMPPTLIPSESVIGLNAPVMAFTVVLAALTALIFGLAPALQMTRRDLNDPLRQTGRGVIGGFRAGRMRHTLVVLEVAVSLTLLIGAGLMMRSFVALEEVNLGVRADHVFVTELLLPPNRYKTPAQISRFFQPLLARVKALPGVADATESSTLPPYGGGDSKIEMSGKSSVETWHAQVQSVSEGYFRVLRIPFKVGRAFSETEINQARKVAVVNQTFVSRYLHGADPIGRRVKLTGLESLEDPAREAWFEVVGVVADVANQGPPQYGRAGLRAPVEPELWVPYTVTGSGLQFLFVRSEQTPIALTHDVQQAVWATDSGVALVGSAALEDVIEQVLYGGPRFALVLMIIFGCVGLILVTVGVYSVLAYATAQKTHEIGIRMALGAERADVLRLVIGTGLRLVGAGVAIGLIVSQLLMRVIQAELWRGVKPYDPLTSAAMALLLLATGVLACWVPARRAARVDPMVALRYE
jgi:putative ABC transport system permease protein